MQNPHLERRKTARRLLLSGGHIVSGNSAFACLVRDISSEGACLEIAAGITIPDRCRLVLEAEGLEADCDVAWRHKQEIGVKFLSRNVRRTAALAQPQGRVRHSTTAPRVLVAEDDPIYSDMAMHTLSEAGFSARACLDGAEALKIADAEPFDIILLDFEMPGIDGLSIIRAVRAAGPNAATPLVIMTGHDNPEVALDAYRAGVTAFIVKPIDWDSFAPNIQRVLDSSRELAEETGLMEKVRGWADSEALA